MWCPESLTDVFIHQEVLPPHDCIICFGVLPTRDASRDTTAVERSSLSIGDTVLLHMVDRFMTQKVLFLKYKVDMHSGTCCGYGWQKKKLSRTAEVTEVCFN